MLSSVLQPAIDLLHQLAGVLPTEIFVAIGAFVEELVAPIPSPLVMTLGGSLAASQGKTLTYLGLLALLGAIGKTVGSWLIYLIADKAEDFVMNKIGKFVGVTHREVEIIGKHLNKGWRDDVILFLLRAVPIMPTAPVSIVCGLIKLNLRTYLTSTFFGTLVRNVFYLYLGYTSVDALESLNEGIDSFEKFGYLILLVVVAIAFAWIYQQKKKDAGLSFLEKRGETKKKV